MRQVTINKTTILEFEVYDGNDVYLVRKRKKAFPQYAFPRNKETVPSQKQHSINYESSVEPITLIQRLQQHTKHLLHFLKYLSFNYQRQQKHISWVKPPVVIFLSKPTN